MDDGVRKAAIFIASLDPDAADVMLRHMGASGARLVRKALMQLGPINSAEQSAIADEFLAGAPPELRAALNTASNQPTTYAPPVGGLGRHLSAGADLVAHDANQAASTPNESASRFEFLREAEDENLAKLLYTERPQTIALVLAHLPPEQAGRVLIRFDPAMQAEVLARLTELEETDELILQEVEAALQSRAENHVIKRRRRVAGVSAVSDILEASPDSVQSRILTSLHMHNRGLAERLRPNELTFDDVLMLDDDDIGVLLSSVDPRVAILALVGAPNDFIDRILRRLPKAEADQVRHQLHHIAPTRLRDVEEARDRIVEKAYELAVRNRIHVGGRTPKLDREPAATIEYAA